MFFSLSIPSTGIRPNRFDYNQGNGITVRKAYRTLNSYQIFNNFSAEKTLRYNIYIVTDLTTATELTKTAAASKSLFNCAIVIYT